MPSIYGFSVRSSGRDLNAVRRPRRPARYVAPVKGEYERELERPDHVPGEYSPTLEPDDLNKPDLANLAAAVGVDPSGTKAEVVKRVKKQTNG